MNIYGGAELGMSALRVIGDLRSKIQSPNKRRACVQNIICADLYIYIYICGVFF